MEPLLPKLAVPVLKTAIPLTPLKPESAVVISTDPLLDNEPYPDVILTAPPVDDKDRPADNTTSPPVPLFPDPTSMYKDPPRPAVALPEPM